MLLSTKSLIHLPLFFLSMMILTPESHAQVPTDVTATAIELRDDAMLELPLPAGHNAFVYCFEGTLNIGQNNPYALDQQRLAVLDDGEGVHLTAPAHARAIVVAGRPFNEPVSRYGPFVMNTREELVQAVDDLRAGRF